MPETFPTHCNKEALPTPPLTLDDIRGRIIETIKVSVMRAQKESEEKSLKDWNRYLKGIEESGRGLY